MKTIIIAETVMQATGVDNTIFKRGGIQFFSARSSEEIRDLHGGKKADLIITDSSLPVMGGVKLCSTLRGSPELKAVSIIMVSEASEAGLCREAGANVVIQKPFDPAALLWKASELLLVPQRKDIRVLLRVSVKGLEEGAPFFAQSHDISISGMLLETDRALKPGDQLTCAFNIGHSEVTVTGTIERVAATTTGRFRYGMQFMNCNTKSLVIIEHFVKTQPRR